MDYVEWLEGFVIHDLKEEECSYTPEELRELYLLVRELEI